MAVFYFANSFILYNSEPLVVPHGYFESSQGAKFYIKTCNKLCLKSNFPIMDIGKTYFYYLGRIIKHLRELSVDFSKFIAVSFSQNTQATSSNY